VPADDGRDRLDIARNLPQLFRIKALGTIGTARSIVVTRV
jgi:hypothetical protein